MPSFAAIIVAAGASTRFAAERPKVYQTLGGKAVLRHSIEALQSHNAISNVLVVINPDHRNDYDEAVAGLALPEPVAGGDTRQQSVCNGLKALGGDAPDYVLIHDAARPNLDAELIDRVVQAVQTHDAVIPATPVTDTIKQIDDTLVVATPNRDTLVAVQTPQAFAYAKLLAAHEAHAGEGLSDDAAVAEAAGLAVHTVQGSPHNRKLTYPEDWHHMQPTHTRTGMGFDVHALEDNESKPLMLCGVAIDSPLALSGHSDADVALHALVDALLGSIAAGDIGQHFPPSDAKWRGADSAQFVQHAISLLHERGASLQHIDLTIICETPKVGPHRNAMRERVAELTELAIEAVSVKATTTEKLGFTGRGEGIAAQCVVSVNVPVRGAA